MAGGTATRRTARSQNGRGTAGAVPQNGTTSRTTSRRTRPAARPEAAAERQPQGAPPPVPESVEERASESILGANPFLGIDRRAQVAALRSLALRLGAQPQTLAREGVTLGRELAAVVAGRSRIEPARGDRRFADTTWKENPGYRRAMQGYLACTRTVERLVDGAGLDWRSTERARFATTIVTEALAPTNSLPGNPAALKRSFETGGRSLVAGARNLVHDVRHNRGMPSQVDRRPFVLGENIALSRGAVVLRTEVCELIQFTPTTPQVCARPVVMIPPQINKYYIMDLAPGRSFIENAVAHGLQFFSISWRNPQPEQRDWDLDTYVRGCLDAIGAACEITGSDDVNVMGLCAGGITTSITLAHMAAASDPRVHSVTLPVTMLDMSVPSTAGVFSSERVAMAATRQLRRSGVLSGAEMSRVFAWMRPNDLVWNYWVNNYLMGNPPPAFDILAWNNDTTNLPAALHAQFLAHPPRQRAHQARRAHRAGDADRPRRGALPGVRARRGHRPHHPVARLLPGDRAARRREHVRAQQQRPHPGARQSAGQSQGELLHRAAPRTRPRRLARRRHRAPRQLVGPLARVGARPGGTERPAPEALGSRRHPPMEDAPGTYVRDQA